MTLTRRANPDFVNEKNQSSPLPEFMTPPNNQSQEVLLYKAIKLADKFARKIDRPLHQFSENTQDELIEIAKEALQNTTPQEPLKGGDVQMIQDDGMVKEYSLTRPEKQSVPSRGDSELKSAEGWALEIAREELAAHKSDVNLFHPDFQDALQKLIKQIRLEAFKAGMSEAAEIVPINRSILDREVYNKILTARDAKKTI